MTPNNRNLINNTTLVVAGIVVAAAILLAALIAAFAITQSAANRPVAPQAVPTAEQIVVTRDVPASTLTAQPTYTPQATFTPFPTATPSPTPTKAPTPTPVPTPEWRSLGSLASMEYTDSVLVEREREKPGIGGVLLGKDRVALLAVGRIVMGADLSKIRPSDVKVEGSKITVRVPKPSVIAIELLPDRSRIFDSERSWLFSQYEGLEVEALDEAKRKLNDAAKTNTQMLKLAESLTRLQLTELLRKAGDTDVVIEFVDAK